MSAELERAAAKGPSPPPAAAVALLCCAGRPPPPPPANTVCTLTAPPSNTHPTCSAARSKYGLLEKKKDYRQRARDFHRKDNALKALRRKAEERNPDEFYFGMESARTKDGVHVVPTSEANKYSQAELALMKTQDASYLRAKAQTEAKVGWGCAGGGDDWTGGVGFSMRPAAAGAGCGEPTSSGRPIRALRLTHNQTPLPPPPPRATSRERRRSRG